MIVIVEIVEVIVFVYIAACVLYNLALSLAGRMVAKKKKIFGKTGEYSKIAVLIPAYKEDTIILSTVKSYARLHYPQERHEVIVIADSLQPETLRALQHCCVTVIPVSFEKSTKAASLNAAFNTLREDYDIALICDADNVLSPNFLLKINQAFQEGEYAIQAQRVAKNMDTPFAVLDAANEMIGNHLYRKGANAIGLSSSVIGSGMAFHYPLIKSVMKEIQATGGFDKVLQLEIVARGHSIHYLEEAQVFDEKVDDPAAFRNQRKRWLASQWVYLCRYWNKGWRMLRKGNLDYFNLSVCQNLLLPRLLLVSAIGFCTVLYILLPHYLLISPVWWMTVFVLNCISLLIPIPGQFFRRYLLTALLALPRAAGIMILLLFRLKGANNTFIHTKHSKTDIDNPLLHAVRK